MENNWLDLQHRGYTAYLRETTDTDACRQWLGRILGARASEEKINTVFLDCRVITDWVEQIEIALPYVEKAVRESRQFILRQGQTVPVEKVKRVSRASVEHLSRHSELITKVPEPGGDLRPDKLHMTENVGTYAVYENRFLYMLLCLIRDFAGYRYRKITELSASFSTDMTLSKEVSDSTGKIGFSLRYTESAQGKGSSAADDAVARIRNILQSVDILLATDLMREVSEEPMLKPPVTRTNAMLHDPNFKAAFELYTFLAAYAGPGYEQIQLFRSDEKLTDMARNDLAALVALTSYLSHRCGGLYGPLQERYLAEEARRREENRMRRRENLTQLKQRLGSVSEEAAAYILGLEQLLAEVDSRDDRLLEQKAETERLRLQVEAAAKREAGLGAEIQSLAGTLAEKERCLAALTQESAQAQARQEEIRRRFKAELQQQKQEFLKEYEALKEKYHLAGAMGRDLEAAEDCSSREAFAALEAQYKAFGRFYDRQWKLARKKIRKDTLWKK